MRALTVTQPFATLLAYEEKRVETRSWMTNYRGPLAIHAAKTTQGVGGDDAFVDLVRTPPFAETLCRLGYVYPQDLPRGGILCLVTLIGCVRVDQFPVSFDTPWGVCDYTIEGNEYAFGDYNLGRYGWLVTNVWRLPGGMHVMPGMRGLWSWRGSVARDLLDVYTKRYPPSQQAGRIIKGYWKGDRA